MQMNGQTVERINKAGVAPSLNEISALVDSDALSTVVVRYA